MAGMPPNPAGGGAAPDGADVWSCYSFTVPGVFIQLTERYPQGTMDPANQARCEGESLFDTFTCQAVTPLTADTACYFFAFGPRAANADQQDFFADLGLRAFHEDKRMIEAQWQVMQATSTHGHAASDGSGGDEICEASTSGCSHRKRYQRENTRPIRYHRALGARYRSGLGHRPRLCRVHGGSGGESDADRYRCRRRGARGDAVEPRGFRGAVRHLRCIRSGAGRPRVRQPCCGLWWLRYRVCQCRAGRGQRLLVARGQRAIPTARSTFTIRTAGTRASASTSPAASTPCAKRRG